MVADGSVASALMPQGSITLLFAVILFIHHESAICYCIVPLAYVLDNHLLIKVQMYVFIPVSG